jgi:hypothetical protein
MRLNFKSALKRFTLLGGVFACLLTTQNHLHSVWQQPPTDLSIGQDVAGLSEAQLAVNSQGNALAVWRIRDPDFFDEFEMVSSFFIRGVGWTPAQIISSLALNSAGFPLFILQFDPDVVLNSSNYGLAGWEGILNTLESGSDVVIVTLFNNGVWSPVQIISEQPSSRDASSVNLALNEAGTALAAWLYLDGNTGDANIAARFLPFGGVWSAPHIFPTFPGGNQGKPCPAINSSGNAVITWQGRTNAGKFTVMAANYDAGTATWSAPVTLDTDLIGTDISQDPRCAIDSNGNAVAVWHIEGETKAAFFNGTSWEAPIVLGPGTAIDGNDGPAVVMDLNGNATVVWETEEGDIVTSFRLPNGTWSAPLTISQPGTDNSFAPEQSNETLAVNRAGDVIAIWVSTNIDSGLITNVSAFKPFGLPWQAPEFISDLTGDSSNTNIGLADCAFAVALWDADSGEGNSQVLASINGGLILPLAIHARISSCCEKFAMQTNCLNFLTWESPDCVLSFNIFRDGVLIANVLNTGGPFLFIDPIGGKKPHVYTITTINTSGIEGPPVVFIPN